MALSGNIDTVRMSFKAAASAKTTTSQYRVAIGDYTTTDYGSLYAAVLATVGITSPVLGIIDSFQTANSEVVSVITMGLAKAYCAGTSCATFTAGDVLCWETETCGVMPYDATGLSMYIVGYALEMGYTATYAHIFVKPQYRGAGLIT
jgi:hypothetical protein